MLLITVAACENDDTTQQEAQTDPLSCDSALAPCGGDLVGTWSLIDRCRDDDWSTTSTVGDYVYCPGAVTGVELSVDSTLAFAADHAYALDSTVTLAIFMETPPECLEALGLTECDQLATVMDYDYDDVQCSQRSNMDCRCEVVAYVGVTGDGTWSVDAGVLTMSEAFGTSSYNGTTTSTSTFGPYDSAYCVDGDRLRLVSDESYVGGLYARF